MNCRAACRELNRSGNTGAYFSVLFHASLNGLSLETLGLEWDRVTPRSSSRAATGLLVIDVPRSACTTCGMPWTPKISVINSTANAADSGVVHVLADDVPRVNVDHHVAIEIQALAR